ncbi:MAG TPA: aldo/keto reductase [Propionibacteriaceae bacterium]|nr:aldo/keto reductase [Propionibacteriaceae bacterium]
MKYVSHASGKQLSRIGLGTWQFGSREWGYGPDYDEREAAAIVARALELGVTLFDTAEIYGMGRSERILGRALRRADADPARVVLASKVFPVLPTAPVVEQRAVASASRLGTRHIDLYQVHQSNPVVSDPTTMRGMQALLDVGLIGSVGVSNYSLDRWRAADAALAQAHSQSELSGGDVPVVVSNQVQYSLVHRQPETDLLPFAEAHDRLVIAYSPLAQGLLSARHRPGDRVTGVRAANSHFLPENLEASAPLLDTLRDVAASHQVTPAQVALAWTLRHPSVVAIPGASSVAQVESNVAAADLELTPGELDALTAASDRYHPVVGLAAVPSHLRRLRASRA